MRNVNSTFSRRKRRLGFRVLGFRGLGFIRWFPGGCVFPFFTFYLGFFAFFTFCFGFGISKILRFHNTFQCKNLCFRFFLHFTLLFLLFVLDLGFGKFYFFTIPSSWVLLCTTKYYSSTSLYYKVLVQYYSSTTLYYKVLVQYYTILQSTNARAHIFAFFTFYLGFFVFFTFCFGFGVWEILLFHHTFHPSTTLYYKVLLQYYSVLQSTSPILFCTTKY